MITEAGCSVRLPTGPPLAQRHYVNGEIGRMTNRPGGTAVGVALFAGALVDYDFQLRVGITPRYRRWLGPRSSVEVSAGPISPS